jgi:uncharacterized protein
MLHYIIDGNNLIGKIKRIKRIQDKDKVASREQLLFTLENYFYNKKAKVTLHFDGFKNLPLKVSKIKVIYSDNKTADEKIKNQIEISNIRKNLIVVTSDNNLKEFAKVCGCKVITSEEFNKALQSSNLSNEEQDRINEINNVDEFKKLFDAE